MDRMQIRENIELECSRLWRQVVAEIEATPNVYLKRLMEKRREQR